ncbi:hypothetical protein [Candidatus Uabimicrobium amorphum]|uniref:Uncharacterized protein n=1 Tax=Uabimicrobium amorphum TaxID=2596890 RepID=A0A5S9IR83_UABAM|nr:hypothetical protein [Candidatus Uabimicrobium amorphum]BBM85972.1 hypothetical protein UABAM_04358 [Candidatus Uabimicrobium amorphum]
MKIIALLFTIHLCFTLTAENENWEKVFSAKDIISFAQDDSSSSSKNIWAASTSGKLFFSTDGQSWNTSNVQTEGSISHVVSQENIVFVAFRNKKKDSPLLSLSLDGGKNWNRVGQDIISQLPSSDVIFVTDITISKNSLFVVTRDFRPHNPTSRCFRSDNFGASWSLIHQMSDQHSINTVAVDSNRDVLLGTSSGVLRSKNGHGNWEPLNGGMETNKKTPFVKSISYNHTLGERFAATSAGIFKSHEEGAWQFPKGSNWQNVSSHKSQQAAVALNLIHNYSTSYIVMGTHERSGIGGHFFSTSRLFISNNSQNVTWKEIDLGSLTKKPLYDVIVHERHVIIATSEGVFKSTKSILELGRANSPKTSSAAKVIFFDLGDTLVVSGKKWATGAQQILQQMKSKRLGIISNTGNLSRSQLLELLPQDFSFDSFDENLILLSSEVKIEKPDPQIFQMAIKRAQQINPSLEAQDCLFVTEDMEHLSIARGLGIQTAILVDGKLIRVE